MFDPRAVACPYANFKRTCHQTRQKYDCPKWVAFNGENPNTGEKISEWACADRWLPFLLADANRRLIGVQSAVETRGDAATEQQARTSWALERIASATPIAEGAALLSTPRRTAILPPAKN